METIFVRKVKNPGPAQQAGLQKGDRIVAVNGVQVIDKPYSFVIQLIQKSPVYLHLLVVPKEDDALQRLFKDTAYIPVSNQDFETPRDRITAQNFLTQTFARGPSQLQVDVQFWNSLRYPFGYYPTRVDKRQITQPIIHKNPTQASKELYNTRIKNVPQEIYSEIKTNDNIKRDICRAQPQVPIYKKMGRRASEGNTYEIRQPFYEPEYSCITSDDDMVLSGQTSKNKIYNSSNFVDTTSQSSANMSVLTYPSSAGCRLSLDGDRKESNSSLTSSYPDGSKDSLSSFGSSSTLTGQDTDDSIILSRYRKSFQRKEEFLKTPTNSYESALIQREFYGRPKKLEKTAWPPNENSSPSRQKPTHQHFQRVKNDIEIERDLNSQGFNQMATGGIIDVPQQKVAKSPKDRPNVNKLTLIHEASTAPQDICTPEGMHSAYSGENEDERVYSPTQYVHQRAKQFESGKPLPEDDPLISDRTSFYRSELARISSKKVVPNVAERAHEYEERAVEPRRDPISNANTNKKIYRDSRSLDSSGSNASVNDILKEGKLLSGNVTISTGSKYIHCPLPSDLDRNKTDVSKTLSQGLHVRSHSAESWAQNNKKMNRQDALAENASDQVSPELVPIVKRRVKNHEISDEDKVTRRESYLKATESSRMHFECDFSDGEVSPQVLRSAHRRWRPPMFPGDIQQLRKLFEDAASSFGGSVSGNSSSSTSLDIDKAISGSFEKDTTPKEGLLNCKIIEIDGKRPAVRSWRQTWAVLKGPKLFLYKDRNHHSPVGASDILEPSIVNGVDIRTSLVRVAEDYTKRKHVLRVASVNPCRSEILLQAENQDDLAEWVHVLSQQATSSADVDTKLNTNLKHHTIPSLTAIQVQGSRLSPQPSKSKTISVRNRSPTGQSPVSKSRKPLQIPSEPATSPKSKTWRGRVAKQLRKIQGTSSPSSPTATEGSTFGVPLDQCLPSLKNHYVPRFVEVCTDIVDARGLQVVGIYRVPGNNASITALSEDINKNYEDVPIDDPRWSDVHVVSSLLKSFFRKLPDSLVTNSFYLSFIKADKIDDPKSRMKELRRLVKSLPPHNYHTLKHLVFHLNRVMMNSEVNKMDAKNVAIVFGPNIVRPEEETMQDMVSNNSHQCKILVTLLNHPNWFFSESEEECDIDLSTIQDTFEENESNNQQALLDSISKLEALPMPKEKNGALLSSILSAAQRKVKRKTKGPSSLPDKEEVSSPNGTQSLPSFSPRFSPNDLKENVLDNPKNNLSHSMELDKKPNNMEKVPWFNYATDQEAFQKRIQNFKNETEAMLTRPRYLEITVNKGSKNSPILSTSAGNVNQGQMRLSAPTNDNVIVKTQSATNVFNPKNLSQHNRNSLNCNNTFIQQKQSSKQSERNSEVLYSSVQIYNGDINNTNYQKDKIRGDGTENLCDRINNGIDVRDGSSLDLNSNGVMKKVRYNLQSEVAQKNYSDSGVATDDDTDLVAAITKIYDKKLEDYTQPSILSGENLPYADDSPEKIQENNNLSDKENRLSDLYKNPSLHKSIFGAKFKKEDKSKEKNEKDEDSSVDTPDNEKLKNNSKLSQISNSILNSTNSKLKRSESLNKPERTVSPLTIKIKRSESLNKSADKLKRSDSLTKSEKTEANTNKKRELLLRKSKELKRKNGMPDRSIKRRHTVGGTKDPDKVTWLDKYQEEVISNKENKEKTIRTSSPDLSSTRRERLLFEINLIGPENMVVALRQHLIGGRPQSFPESVFKVPLESHV